jgi:hypothetical protein
MLEAMLEAMLGAMLGATSRESDMALEAMLSKGIGSRMVIRGWC